MRVQIVDHRGVIAERETRHRTVRFFQSTYPSFHTSEAVVVVDGRPTASCGTDGFVDSVGQDYEVRIVEGCP